MDSLGSSLLFIAALLAVHERDNLTAGTAALSLTFAMQILIYMGALIRSFTKLENGIISVERICELLAIPQEVRLAWRTITNEKHNVKYIYTKT